MLRLNTLFLNMQRLQSWHSPTAYFRSPSHLCVPHSVAALKDFIQGKGGAGSLSHSPPVSRRTETPHCSEVDQPPISHPGPQCPQGNPEPRDGVVAGFDERGAKQQVVACDMPGGLSPPLMVTQSESVIQVGPCTESQEPLTPHSHLLDASA